jgi:diaminohydroxyphosphoribosylaminopyrimidine deaminase/5-amino-6-(5-phosphoribosylamino)uracil reductase
MKKKSVHEKYMQECLTLAKKGIGYVSPNPMVGCVVVKNRKVVGRGYHKKFGQPHAEVNALLEAGKRAVGSTLYVNLEPCSHFGKTPPCTDLIISKKVKKVVVAMRDPNPLVNGKGIKKLRDAKIDVIEHVFEADAKKMNEKFIKSVKHKTPFVTLKIAETMDGRIADSTGDSKWITNSQAQKYAHELRAQHDVILVGANTVIKDNPQLNVRHVKGNNPLRVVIDGRLTSQMNSKVFKNAVKTKAIVFTSVEAFHRRKTKVAQLEQQGVIVLKLSSKSNQISLNQVMKQLHKMNISSILVEGGANILSQFINDKLADKLVVIIAPKILGDGIQSITLGKNISIKKVFRLSHVTVNKLGDNVLIEGYFIK